MRVFILKRSLFEDVRRLFDGEHAEADGGDGLAFGGDFAADFGFAAANVGLGFAERTVARGRGENRDFKGAALGEVRITQKDRGFAQDVVLPVLEPGSQKVHRRRQQRTGYPGNQVFDNVTAFPGSHFGKAFPEIPQRRGFERNCEPEAQRRGRLQRLFHQNGIRPVRRSIRALLFAREFMRVGAHRKPRARPDGAACENVAGFRSQTGAVFGMKADVFELEDFDKAFFLVHGSVEKAVAPGQDRPVAARVLRNMDCTPSAYTPTSQSRRRLIPDL